jgi:protein subunit release factor B
MCVVELRAATGGEDSKNLVEEQAAIYARLAAKRGL